MVGATRVNARVPEGVARGVVGLVLPSVGAGRYAYVLSVQAEARMD